MERITSRKNPLLEHMRRLDSAAFRRQQGEFLCDSPKLVEEALRHGARVLAVADAPGQGAASERFRPRYAVDIQILTADGEPDPAFPTYTAVPLPVPTGAGQEKGLFSFPEPGAQVVVGFAYGRPDHPIIRQTYPLGVSLPEVAQGEQLWQSTPAVYQRADAGGNWTRATEAKIEDASRERVVRAQTSADELGTETRTIREHSKESVGGIKQIEATTLSLVGGLRADLGSLGNVNMTAGAHSTITTGKARTDTTGGDFAEDVGGNRTAKVAGNAGDEVAGARNRKIGGDETTTVSGASTEKVGGAKTVTAAQMTFNSESTIGFNAGGGDGGGTSVFREFLGFCDEVLAALDVLAAHDHPDAGTINQGGSVSGHRAAAGQHREKLGQITT